MVYVKRYGKCNAASFLLQIFAQIRTFIVYKYAVLFVSILAGVRRCYRKAFVHLPDDTLLLVLQYLSVKDIYKMRLVRLFLVPILSI